MKIPRISVLMPAYNSEKYIAEAIESILNQTFTDFEFIIINDGSTDNTAKIVKEYAKKDKRIKFVNHTKNKGLIGVLNEGLGLCRGEYIARMDSDDMSLPERFAKQIAYMDSHPECGVLSSAFQMFGVADKVVVHPHYVRPLDLLNGCLVAHPATMIRQNIMETHKLQYDENYKYAEDFELWSRMVFVTEIHNLPDVLLKYRWVGTNISVVHSEQQIKLTNKIKSNILDRLTDDKNLQALVSGCVHNKIKCGILLPKWLGRIVALFIFIPSARRNFRNKYVKS